MEKKTNVLGLIGFIFSIISIVTFGLVGFIGLVLSILGLIESKKCNNDKQGMCIAGIVISAIMSLIFIVSLLVAIFSPSNFDSTVNQNNINNSSNYDTNSSTSSSTNDSSVPSVSSKNKKYGLGDTITFDGLEITFDQNYSFVNVDNMFSEYNGRDVIKLGVSVKNISSDKNNLNMFFYDLFGSQGTELDSITSYFDDNIDFAGDLKPGASYRTNFYILYDGNGNYSIDFDNYSEEVSVEFNVTK